MATGRAGDPHEHLDRHAQAAVRQGDGAATAGEVQPASVKIQARLSHHEDGRTAEESAGRSGPSQRRHSRSSSIGASLASMFRLKWALSRCSVNAASES